MGIQRENLQGMYLEVVHWIFNMNNTMLLYNLNYFSTLLENSTEKFNSSHP
jgi:hypothetical protein